MERIQIQLPEEQAARLRAMARERGVSLAGLVRSAVEATLREPGPLTMEERWDRSLAAVGRFSSGERNRVSEEHDRYLEDAYQR